MRTSMLNQFTQDLQKLRMFQVYGRVVKVIGLTIESIGPHAVLGDVCFIRSSANTTCLAEVVGFREERLVLMALGDLSSVAPGADVLALHKPLSISCGPSLLGRVLDGLGQPIDHAGPIVDAVPRSIEGVVPDPLSRQTITRQIQTGVRVIDSLLSIGEGQRMGIFAGSGVGKSTLLSMIARNTSADMNVIALIGERGREVREFLEQDLGDEGRKRSVVVVATSDQPALIRIKAAYVATAIAEYFRDLGHRVNFMLDSITRFAMAQREVGLAIGEPPTSRGYTPSVFALLPKLLERAGAGEQGTMTAFYTVLVDGDDMNDPIADAVRGILDGHIVLSRQIANAGHFPAIDILSSLSRLFPSLVQKTHYDAALQLRRWVQKYRDVEDLLRIGAYQMGSDADADMAISKMPQIQQFIDQSKTDTCSLEGTIDHLYRLAGVSA